MLMKDYIITEWFHDILKVLLIRDYIVQEFELL